MKDTDTGYAGLSRTVTSALYTVITNIYIIGITLLCVVECKVINCWQYYTSCTIT